MQMGTPRLSPHGSTPATSVAPLFLPRHTGTQPPNVSPHACCPGPQQPETLVTYLSPGGLAWLNPSPTRRPLPTARFPPTFPTLYQLPVVAVSK